MKIAITALLILLLPWPADGQEGARDEADRLLRQFRATGDFAVPLRISLDCPSESAVSAELLSLLIQERLTSEEQGKVASAWAPAMASCEDARLGRWYRDQLESSRGLAAPVADIVVAALLRSGKAENLSAVRSFATNSATPIDQREIALEKYARSVEPPLRLQVFGDVLRSGTMPVEYLTYEISVLLGDPETAHGFRVNAARQLRDDPEVPGAADVLMALAVDLARPRVPAPAGWRSEYQSLLEFLKERPGNSPILSLTIRNAELVLP